ncbi:unnamed protein product [Aphanomyces euteiches]
MTLWTEELDKIWLNEMIHQAHVLGKTSNTGFKKEAWRAALDNLNKTPECSFKMEQLKSRHTNLKAAFSVVSKMANTSGMSFERSTCRVECLTTTWDAFLLGKSDDIKKWKNKPFPLYDLCERLYHGTLAQGAYVVSSASSFHASTATGSITAQIAAVRDEVNYVEESSDLDHDDDDAASPASFGASQFIEPEAENPPLEKKRRRIPNGESPAPQRARQSAATVLAQELKNQSDSIANELAFFSKTLLSEGTRENGTVVQSAIA